jgi:hypothetical protein
MLPQKASAAVSEIQDLIVEASFDLWRQCNDEFVPESAYCLSTMVFLDDGSQLRNLAMSLIEQIWLQPRVHAIRPRWQPKMEKRALKRTSSQFMRYGLAILFFAGGVYLLFAMLQSASYSVPAPPVMSEIYKTRAMLAWPIALLFFSVGVLFFICLRPREK